MFLRLLFSALFLVPVFLPILSAQSLIVDTTSGPIEGFAETVGGTKLAIYKGIPFAAPPVGELRWREPQPMLRWTATRSAKSYGQACLQIKGKLIPTSGEDCLTLNIWTPRAKPSRPLPVMVWIHGGAFRIGANSLAIFDGSWLARRDVVIVTINYRQGMLGFFAHPALGSDAPMNFGLLDQVAALQWVRDNIGQFHGDAANVTIFGESGGAVSVEYLLASPPARGLFHKAIVQSGGGWLANGDRPRAESVGLKFSAALGLAAPVTAEALRAIPADRILAATPQVIGGPEFGPIAGDAVAPLSIEDAFARGAQAPVPLIVGANSHEGSLREQFNMPPAAVFADLGPDLAAARYLYGTDLDETLIAEYILGDSVGLAPARWIATQHSRVAPTFNYYLTYLPWLIKRKVPGVAHGLDIPFVFDSFRSSDLRYKLTPKDRAMVNRIGECWTNFAKTSAPTCKDVNPWPRFDSRNRITIEFGPDVIERRDLLNGRLDFFEQRYFRLKTAPK